MLITTIKPQQTYKLRLKVLKTCKDYQYKYLGDFNKNSLHFGAFKNNEHVGIVSLMENDHHLFNGKQVQLRGMAMLNDYQGKRIGEKLITAFINESKNRNANVIWCNARDYSIGFYKKYGFKIKGNRFFIKNVCDHYLMFLNLNTK